MVHILVVDDEELFLDFICKALHKAGWEHVDRAGDGVSALARLASGHYALCLLDLWMPRMGGLEVIRLAREMGIQTDIVVLTGYGSIDSAVAAMKMGAREYLTKPIRAEQLKQTVSRLLLKHQPLPQVLAERLDLFLAEHAARSSLRAEDLCRHFTLSARHLTRLFSEYLGTSFPRRLAYHRVQLAKQQIAANREPLQEIARACGFRDYRRLYEAFVELEGINPSQYRKMMAE
jgi:YesN/AraC family two-component response regulator